MSTEAYEPPTSYSTTGVFHQTEQLFRILIENSADAVALVSHEGLITYISPSVQKMLGYTPEELTGRRAIELIPSEHLSRALEHATSISQTPGMTITVEHPYFHKDGSIRWLESTTTNHLHHPDIRAYVSNFRDITERRQAEVRILFLASLAESISDAVVATNMQYRITSWNDAAEAFFGWSRDEVMGKVATDILTTNFPYSTRGREEWQEQLATKGYWKGEVLQQRKDGTPIASLASVSVVKDKEGNIVGLVSINRDITERKQTEERKDEFVSMVSHELKTPVTSIKGFTQVLQRRLQKLGEQESLRYLGIMDRQLNKLTKLINDLLDISKMQSGKIAYQETCFDLTLLLQETVENLQQTIQTHKLLLADPDSVQVQGDRDRIEQVLINLISNAIKYSPRADTVIIRVTTDPNAKNALVSVQDFGIGIEEADHAKIFERFYQAPDLEGQTYPGLGIGLYISQEIVQRHSGRLWLESQKGVGTTFYMGLPLCETQQ